MPCNLFHIDSLRKPVTLATSVYIASLVLALLPHLLSLILRRMPCSCRIAICLLAGTCRLVVAEVPILILAPLLQLAQLGRGGPRWRRHVRLASVGRHASRCGFRGLRSRLLRVGLLELVLRQALLRLAVGLHGALSVDLAFGEVVGTAAGDDERAPAVAWL